MTVAQLIYASPSAVSCEPARTVVGLTANERRPVRLNARLVRDVFPIRLALSTLCEVLFGSSTSRGGTHERGMEPLVTIHSDRVTFEVFSGDGSTYGRVSIDSGALEPDGDVTLGTSTVDLNRWLWESLSDLRSTRETWLRIDPDGGATGEGKGPRSERHLELSGDRIRRLLEMQVAASCSSIHLVVRPVDALSLFGELMHAGAGAATGTLRYSIEPGQDASVVLEPTEKAIRLRGAGHEAVNSLVVRTWGRGWLRLLAPVLPHADDLHLFLRSSGWPSFYVVQLPSVSIVLGMRGDDAWSHGIRGDMAQLAPPVPPEFLSPVLAPLVSQRALSADDAIVESGLEPRRAMRALARLCRAGRAVYEPETGRYRHREMFELPIDIASLEVMDPRAMGARAFVRDGEVSIQAVERRERRRRGRASSSLRGGQKSKPAWDLEVAGTIGDGVETRVVIRDGGQLAFGLCSCPHFREWMMHRGPCEHMLALVMAAEEHWLGKGDPEGAGRAPDDPV
jgi:SWIM zinc finger